MITIWKTPIVATVEQVLKDLKLQLYGAGLLKEIKNTGSDLMCTCPFHANGKEHNPSCGVLLQQKVTKPNIIGYEIKVSRNDFLQDNKWHLYLQYCNEFYFVVPKGLVKKEELPDHVGLIYFNPDTKALRTVKKALYRQIEEPVGVYKYIIFSRLEEDRIPFYNDRAEYCKDYLEDKVVKSAIGQRLGTKLAKDLEEAEKKLKSLQNVEKELQAWKSVKKVLDKAGILPWRWWDNDSWVTELEQRLNGKMDPIDLELVIKDTSRLLNRLQAMQVQEEQDDKS